MTTKELGDVGESLAINFLRKEGFQIIKTNYRFGRYEVDIIYKDGEEIVFTEVKTRQTAEIGPPWKAVTRSKQRQIITCAHHYLVENNIDSECRFDIISIVYNSYRTEIEHIQDAFYPML
ncbi:MAG: YraN family protein [Brumimicrobium sp.]|nr:YraN family protein [Brumimicrobium sp.]